MAFVNTTSDAVARKPLWLKRFEDTGLPLLGDDLASQFGTSVVHNALLRLLDERGLTLVSSYQVNPGATNDFHEPSGAAGVNIDLIRIAATALRSGVADIQPRQRRS